MKRSGMLVAFLNLMFPARCVACNMKLPTESRFACICEPCFAGIPTNGFFACPVCRRRLYDFRIRCHPRTHFVLIAATTYAAPAARKLIHALKYRGTRSAAEPLAVLLTGSLQAALGSVGSLDEEFLAVPVPLHPRRERKRGFNQSLLIANALAGLFPGYLTLHPDIAHRLRNTVSQTEFSDTSARHENVAASFSLDPNEDITGRTVLLIDDVCTSGATLEELARIVKQAGAKTVIGLVVAGA